jgi:hypothetical protein
VTSARQKGMHTAAHFMFAKIKSRQSRVERKALVFFPTLNKRLSSAAFSFDLILAVGRAAYRRSGGGDFHLSLSSTEKTKRSFPTPVNDGRAPPIVSLRARESWRCCQSLPVVLGWQTKPVHVGGPARSVWIMHGTASVAAITAKRH